MDTALIAANTIRAATPTRNFRVTEPGFIATASLVSRGISDKNGTVVISGDSLTTIGAATVALTGAIAVNDTTTPSVTTTAGSTNTGNFKVNGKTSGSIKLTTADSTAQAITITGAAQTTGASTWTIPDAAGANQTFVTLALAQTLTNKTLTSPVIGTGLTASGSASNDFSSSTGTFKTSSGLTTISGGFATSTATLSGAGAISIVAGTTKYTSTGGGQALTLANGTDGQIVRIIHDVDGGSGILTPTTKTGFSTITFTAVGESATLQYVTTRGWIILSLFGAVAA